MAIEIGYRSGRLVVVAESEKRGRHRRWDCLCDCGKTTTTLDFSLRAGSSKSCGCIAAEKSKARWATPSAEREALRAKLSRSSTNASHRLSKHPAYRSWADMKSRCTVSSHKWFPSYGARGITVCQEWLDSFEAFWNDMGETWFPKAQLGRKNNDGPYCKNNCEWETAKQQQNNKSNNVFIDTPMGRVTLARAAEIYGISSGCLSYRLSAGYTGEDLFKPSQRKSKHDN